MDLSKFKSSELTFDINYKLIPVSLINLDELGANEWNKLLDYIYSLDLHLIKRTPSGGISLYTRLPAFDVRKTTNCVELTLLIENGCYRIQLRSKESLIPEEEKQTISGSKAFQYFRKLCVKHNINIDALAITNGAEVKETIPTPPITVFTEELKDQEISPAFHIDLNSSFNSGIAKAFPELKPVIEEIYNKRKVDPINKHILTHLQGYMQSLKCCNAKWAHIAKAGIEFNNLMIKKLSMELIKQNKIILTYNTDGIWYTSDDGRPIETFSDPDLVEGPEMGQFKHDHKYCRFRFKSAGCYEFIENNHYYPVVRGRTKLDLVKPRSQWGWGDIYNSGDIIQFKIDAKGYVYNEKLIKY